MPETVNEKQIFSLLEVTASIQKTIADRYKSSFWVKAEMNKLNYYKHSGHCYPELVEKKDGKVIAQIRSHIWKADFERVNNQFQQILKEPLKDGIKILFQAKITFDPAYGLALWIMDIDPAYTLGDLEKEKQHTIRQLHHEGIFNKNKTLHLPLLPQRVAIISVESSKGYVDFLKVIEGNPWHYRFFHMLFPSLLQGDKAVSNILLQLKNIEKVQRHFDVVAIIRGGGGDVGLSCYNNEQLAKAIALFPLPVITGIGHATNETVSEMVSYSNAITPTKLAEYLLQKFHNFSVPLHEGEQKLADKSKRIISEEKAKFQSELKLFRSVTESIINTHQNEIKGTGRTLFQHAHYIFRTERDNIKTAQSNIVKGKSNLLDDAKLEVRRFAMTIRKDSNLQLNQFNFVVSQMSEKITVQSRLLFKSGHLALTYIEKNIENMSPSNVLKRGYSITRLNGKSVKNIQELSSGDTIHTTVFEGSMISIIQSTNKSTEP